MSIMRFYILWDRPVGETNRSSPSWLAQWVTWSCETLTTVSTPSWSEIDTVSRIAVSGDNAMWTQKQPQNQGPVAVTSIDINNKGLGCWEQKIIQSEVLLRWYWRGGDLQGVIAEEPNERRSVEVSNRFVQWKGWEGVMDKVGITTVRNET